MMVIKNKKMPFRNERHFLFMQTISDVENIAEAS
jgi:hypothetical protein